MNIKTLKICAGLAIMLFAKNNMSAQNPLIRNQYSADPSARVFGNKVYVYPSHDILATPGKGRVGWFCMEDYHVFSSADLTNWTDHGMIVTQNKVPWVKPNSYSMWAPDCIERNGKYYLYFPTAASDTLTYGKGFTVGVAIADKPEGPFVPQPTPIIGVHGIDPNVFIDKDKQAYLYWSNGSSTGGNIYAAKLNTNMTELASDIKTFTDLPAKGLKEGPYMFERNGKYYLTYPHVENKIERLEYGVSDNPLGPFTFKGVIMDESPTGCWTNHHSIIQFKNQWYLFYHHNDYSPGFDKARSIRADSLSFNEDGSIKKVLPTLRGIGLSNASEKIEIDRYSAISDKGASIEFVDTANKFNGWKTIFNSSNAWIKYNSIDFTKKNYKSININVKANNGGTLELRSNDDKGALLGKITLPKAETFKSFKIKLVSYPKGIQNICLVAKTDNPVETDWVSFE